MTYPEAISQSEVVMVEFYATWCPHCKQMKPVVEQVKELLDTQVPVLQLDIDENSEIASENNVESVPTFLIYKNGKEMWRHSGEIDGNNLYSKIQSYI